MTNLKKLFARLRKDEAGATMVEYSILVGLITAAVILLVVGVGDWVGDQWTTLCTNLSNAPGNPCSAAGAD